MVVMVVAVDKVVAAVAAEEEQQEEQETEGVAGCERMLERAAWGRAGLGH